MLKNTQKDKNPNSIDLSDKVSATYLRFEALDKFPLRLLLDLWRRVI